MEFHPKKDNQFPIEFVGNTPFNGLENVNLNTLESPLTNDMDPLFTNPC